MQQNSGFSMEEAAKLLSTQEGQQLLQLMQQDGGKSMQAAFAAVQSGDGAKAMALLAPLLADPKAAELLDRLNGAR